MGNAKPFVKPELRAHSKGVAVLRPPHPIPSHKHPAGVLAQHGCGGTEVFLPGTSRAGCRCSPWTWLVETRALKEAASVELARPPPSPSALNLDLAPSPVSLRTSAWPKLHGKF